MQPLLAVSGFAPFTLCYGTHPCPIPPAWHIDSLPPSPLKTFGLWRSRILTALLTTSVEQKQKGITFNYTQKSGRKELRVLLRGRFAVKWWRIGQHLKQVGEQVGTNPAEGLRGGARLHPASAWLYNVSASVSTAFCRTALRQCTFLWLSSNSFYTVPLVAKQADMQHIFYDVPHFS